MILLHLPRFILRVTPIMTLLTVVHFNVGGHLLAQPPSGTATNTTDAAAQRDTQASAEVATPAQARAWQAAELAAAKFDYRAAVKLATQAIKAGPHPSFLYYERGRWNFRAGDAKASLADFDQLAKLSPAQANRLWERGISCYYAGKFGQGAAQFRDYQKHYSNDVENSVWCYLCQQQTHGAQQARRQILPIQHDPRVPMMEIYRLFRGQSTPEKVLQELQTRGSKHAKHARQEAFDAHLYLGLYYDSQGQANLARRHIDKAVGQMKNGHYMWSVAVMHQRRLQQQAQAQAKQPASSNVQRAK